MAKYSFHFRFLPQVFIYNSDSFIIINFFWDSWNTQGATLFTFRVFMFHALKGSCYTQMSGFMDLC